MKVIYNTLTKLQSLSSCANICSYGHEFFIPRGPINAKSRSNQIREVDTRHVMSQAKFYEGYSRWDDDKERYESWDESVSRVMEMHRGFYAEKDVSRTRSIALTRQKSAIQA